MNTTTRLLILALLSALPVQAQHLLAPMDQAQTDHLRAYGLTYWCLQAPRGYECEWLLNYRAGSFLLPDLPDVRARAKAMNVAVEVASDGALQRLYKT
ncbi:MAG: asparagine synthetase B, partial [Armatimonadota bacterium]